MVKTYRLEHVPVLEQSLLGDVRLLEVDAQLQVLEHDRFENALAPVVRPFLVPKHLVEGVEGSARAADLQEFCTRQEDGTLVKYDIGIIAGRTYHLRVLTRSRVSGCI